MRFVVMIDLSAGVRVQAHPHGHRHRRPLRSSTPGVTVCVRWAWVRLGAADGLRTWRSIFRGTRSPRSVREKRHGPRAHRSAIGKSDEYRRTIGAIVYEAMVEIPKAPVDDRFQVIDEHSQANMIFDPRFFGIDRSKDRVFIQLTLVEGRSLDRKARFYERIVAELRARIGLRPEDVFVGLVSTAREDRSFGNGRASLST